MVDSPWLLKVAHVIPVNTSTEGLDLTQSKSMPMMCEIVSMADQFLMTILMYFLASLSIYVFCRKANPSIPTTSDITLRVSYNKRSITMDYTSLYFSCMVSTLGLFL